MNEIARLQKIIAEQADQIRKGVGESRSELAEAREEQLRQAGVILTLDRDLAAERKRRGEITDERDECLDLAKKIRIERDTLRAKVRTVMDRMQTKAAQQGENRDDDPTFGQNFDDAYDAGRTAGEVSVAKEVANHLTLALGDST